MTHKAHIRFWTAMAERYGARWTQNYGDVPAKAWTDLLDRFTPDEVRSALEGLSSLHSPEHPPTMPQFETLLRQAQAKRLRSTDRDYRRDHWRSVVVATASRHMVRLEQIKQWHDLEDLIVEHRLTLGASLRHVIDELCDMEQTTGQRTDGMNQYCDERVRAVCAAFAAERAA